MDAFYKSIQYWYWPKIMKVSYAVIFRWTDGGAEGRTFYHRCGQVVDSIPVPWWTGGTVQPSQRVGQLYTASFASS